MHELSIAESVISTVVEEKERQGLNRITSVGVRIGALSGVLPEALEFGFEMAALGTTLEGARLVIEKVAARGTCAECEHQFEVESAFFLCPVCESGRVNLICGFELDIAYVETEGVADDEESAN